MVLSVLEQTWPSTILVVSHDREFLNTIATDILHLHSQRIEPYHGDYDTFVKTKTERLKNQQREYDAQKEYRDHIQVRLLFDLTLPCDRNLCGLRANRPVWPRS